LFPVVWTNPRVLFGARLTVVMPFISGEGLDGSNMKKHNILLREVQDGKATVFCGQGYESSRHERLKVSGMRHNLSAVAPCFFRTDGGKEELEVQRKTGDGLQM
jgi:hypothetical protein